ncbi:MAG: N-acetylmuramic acid 6-phosphate etherase [Fimbriiglobus sp.]
MDPLQNLQTEARNPASTRLDELTSVELVSLMNREDASIAGVIATQSQVIAQAIDAIATRLSQGGRLIYMGAGTSGRLGVVDASECPPTFQSPPEQVIGLIAGGPGAMFQAVEGAEDSPALGEQDLQALNLTPGDVVCGIAGSGRTPYVLGGMAYARKVGALTVGVMCNNESELEKAVDLPVVAVTGPEILSGSTRLKAGTATKLILNMFTTGAMVRMGKTFGNLMVDMRASNHKLKIRANRIVRTITNTTTEEAEALLSASGGEVKTAIIMHLTKLDVADAREKLAECGGRIGQVLGALGQAKPTETNISEKPYRADLVIGIDGGGTNTVALLAEAATGNVLGRGAAGPSNIQSVGVERGLQALNECIERAFLAAGLPVSEVGAIALGLAGIDRQEGHDVINGWATRERIARKLQIANDATLLLAAGTPEGWGIAVIAGTGSIAFVRDEAGNVGRCGGWGYVLGDEGSAYMIALRGLQAACRAADRMTEPTTLLKRFLTRMNLATPPDLIPAVYRGPWDRAAIASLAPIVFEAAQQGDGIASAIVKSEASELALTTAAAVRNANLSYFAPLALAGGVLLGSELYRNLFMESLAIQGILPVCTNLVKDPAYGALVLAQRLVATQ